MTQTLMLEEMDSDNNLISNYQAGECEEAHVSDQVNGLQHSSTKSHSFVVNMERFSHIIEKDINANSRITLQRNLSRKGSAKIGEKKAAGCDRDTSLIAASPRASLHGSSTPEKPALVPLGATIIPQPHHQITITNGSVAAVPAAETKLAGKRSSFRRANINPRRILIFFATLSCMGSILLIYFTLSMIKLDEDENRGTFGHNQ